MAKAGGRPRRRLRWSGWPEVTVGMLAAVGFLVAGVWQAYDTRALASRGVVVRADVIAERPGRNPSVEVEFVTSAGERIRAETSNYRDLDGASSLDIVYDPRDPHRMQAADWGYDYWLAALCIALAGVMAWWTLGRPTWPLRRLRQRAQRSR